MTDTRTPEQRRKIMQRVKSKDTKPEMAVRRMLHAAGFRYRLHDKSLPGKPDIVFRSRGVVVFVHGCFWHGHGCKYGKLPKSKQDFWRPKIERNVARDEAAIAALEGLGWSVVVVWQCELKDLDELRRRLLAKFQ